MIRAFVAAIAFSVLLAPSALAHGQVPGIEATGIGTASAPAQTAHLQILLSPGAYFGMGPIEIEGGTPSIEVPADAQMFPPTLSEDQLSPVIDLMVGAGIGEDAIVIATPVYTSFFGPGGPGVAEIRATIEQPEGAELAALVAAIHTAAMESGLSVLHVGARYEAADCTALIQQARDAAIADANLRAEGMAQGLGVTLGALEHASEQPYFGPAATESCASAGPTGDFGPYGPGTDPAFDPNAIETTVTVQVTLTYAFEPTA